MLAGRMRHGDNQGNVGLLTPGSVQWMTAGRGIVHSEMPEQEDGLLAGFQLWVNLPAASKMTAPRYQDIAPEAIPVVTRPDGVEVKVIAGTVDGLAGPVEAPTIDPTYLDASLPAGGRFAQAVPEGHSAFVYVFEGTAKVGATAVGQNSLAVLGAGEAVAVAADGDGPARLLLVAGRPLNEPVARYGPFVMNTRAELQQAFADYQAGRF
jgi:redox-sensitive bicupin YhaK (pirin superfamily)